MAWVDVIDQERRRRALEQEDPGFIGGILQGLEKSVPQAIEQSQKKELLRQQALDAARQADINNQAAMEREMLGILGKSDQTEFTQESVDSSPVLSGISAKLGGVKIIPKEVLRQQKQEDEQKKFENAAKLFGIKTAAQKENKNDPNKMTDTLRKEVQGLPQTKEAQTVLAAFEKLDSAFKNPSPAGDMSGIFSYMKMLDPNSTVREGEYANAQNAAGVPDQVLNLYNRAIKGERLNPEQRADFLKQASGLVGAQVNRYNEAIKAQQVVAKERGLPENQIFPSIQAPSPKTEQRPVGTTRVVKGITYTWDGNKWQKPD